MLKVSQLRKKISKNLELGPLSFSVPKGETLCILGPSGAGKSSLLRLIAGLDGLDDGEVFWGEECWSRCKSTLVPVETRNVGVVFQDGALFPHLSVIENVAFGLTEIPTSKRNNEALFWLERLGGKHLRHRSTKTLSGGERQKVALARALARKPKLMLLDEPFSSVDRDQRWELIQTLRRVLKECEATGIIVTHDARDGLDLAQNLAIIKNGQLIEWGKTDNVIHAPKTPWAAQFISSGLGQRQVDHAG